MRVSGTDRLLSQAASSLNPFARGRRIRSSEAIHSSETFHALLEHERARTHRTGQQFSLVRFEATNGNGDAHAALQRLAESLVERIRQTDQIGRYDDRSIGVLLPGTGAKGAWVFAGMARTRTPHATDSMSCTVFTYPSSWVTPKDNGDGDRLRGMPPDPGDRAEEMKGAETAQRHADPPVEDLKPVVARRIPAWKRFVDVFGSLLGLMLLSPLFALIAIVIKAVSPGPVLFRQERIGHGGRTFSFLKFRTMHVDNDSGVHRRYLSSLIQGDQAMEKLDADRDPRIIRFGRFLRQSCLDELPQLINVLRGDMSLVGPRPCLPYEAQEYLLWHAGRFDTVPGMTGLWQVSGKNKTTFKEMIRLDINYTRTMSPWLDLKILLKTGPAICKMVFEHLARKRIASPDTAHAATRRA